MSEEYIIGKEINRKDQERIKKGLVLSNDGNINHDTYHHEEIMDQMIKVIEFTQMDKKMRAIMLLRLIHGFTIQRMQIHLFLKGNIFGNSRDELIALEEEGKRLMKEALQKHTIAEIVGTINAKPSVITGLRNELTNPNPGLS